MSLMHGYIEFEVTFMRLEGSARASIHREVNAAIRRLDNERANGFARYKVAFIRGIAIAKRAVTTRGAGV